MNTPYDDLIEAVRELLRRSGVNERDARFLAGWTVFTLLYGDGDALAGSIVASAIRRAGIKKTLGALAYVARRYGVDAEEPDTLVTAYGWYGHASRIINALLEKLGVKKEVYRIVLGLRLSED